VSRRWLQMVLLLRLVGLQLPLEYSCLWSLGRGMCGECQCHGWPLSGSERENKQRGPRVCDVRTQLSGLKRNDGRVAES
jgi:hypothetical protein